MNPLSRIAGTAVDRAMGLAPAAAPYVVRPNAPVPMPGRRRPEPDPGRGAAPDLQSPQARLRAAREPDRP